LVFLQHIWHGALPVPTKPLSDAKLKTAQATPAFRPWPDLETTQTQQKDTKSISIDQHIVSSAKLLLGKVSVLFCKQFSATGP
jgi:hypothetical protein